MPKVCPLVSLGMSKENRIEVAEQQPGILRKYIESFARNLIAIANTLSE
jgi:hypothetical protein